jgi:hypothetical protein
VGVSLGMFCFIQSTAAPEALTIRAHLARSSCRSFEN